MRQPSEIMRAPPHNAFRGARLGYFAAWLLAHVLAPLLVHGQSPPPTQTTRGKIVDYMVATVDGGLITYSDILWQLTLQPGTPLENPPAEELRSALQLLLDQRLIYQDAEKLPHIHAEDKEVEIALAALIRRFPSQTEFQQRLKRTGLTAERLREVLRERIEVEKYLDFRFRSFVVITPQDIADYYRDVYVPRFRAGAPGRIVPKLEEVRAEIERTLTEAKIETDLGKFLEEARARAEIVILNPLR